MNCESIRREVSNVRLRQAVGAGRLGRAVSFACESMEHRRMFAATVGNSSFETPRLGGATTYQYTPSGATWSFAGNAGIERNGSGFSAPNAPNGSQAAFLQSNVTAGNLAVGSVSQTLNFTTSGTYTVSFQAAARPAKTVLPIQFLVDGVAVGGTISPPSSTSWTPYTTAQFNVTAGSHTIQFLGVDTSTLDKDTFIDTVSAVSVNPPTVATPAAAATSPVTGTSVALSVLGASTAGESTLTYTWSTTGTPPAAVSFSPNGTNAAKNATATFTKAGTYSLLATITNAGGLTATSPVTVVVDQTQTNLAVTPASATVVINGTRQFNASLLDQFGNAMASQPSVTWSKTGVGTLNSTGLYTAPSTVGTATVSATAGAFTSNSAAINVAIATAPTVATAAAASPSSVTKTSTALSVLGADDTGEANLTYTWTLTGTVPAAVTYSANGTNAAKNATAKFAKAGTYNFLVTITNGSGVTTTSSVTVAVLQTTTSIAVTPGAAAIAASGTRQFSAIAFDQFGNAFTTQPTFVWSAASGAGTGGSTAIGSINASTGLYTATITAGTGTVTAAANGVFATSQISVGGAVVANGTVNISTIGTNGYYAVDTNSCAVATDNIWTDTASNHQFASFYTTSAEILIARRLVGASSWQVISTGFVDTAISDDHDVISIAVDSAGYMHMSWGMHNVSLLYAVSNAPVTGTAFEATAFTKLTSANAPTLFPNAGATTNEVTYPQFYRIPNSTNLLFSYRNGGTGGGSGNGNTYFDIYNPTTKTWTNNLIIDGELTSVNAYTNRLVFDSNANLLATWTWRATPAWQSNSNVMFAQSPDAGTTWYRQGGTTPYTLPIIQSGTTASSVAQIVQTIPEGSSMINQGSMTVDQNDNPIVATYMAPNYNVATGTGNVNRQYVLFYYYNGQWNRSQVSNRTSDTSIDTSAAYVRDLGRPLVVVDKQGRVLLVTRSEDTAMGRNSNPTTPNNGIVVYWTTTAELYAGTPAWRTITLSTTNMGTYEPTYDQNLWESQNKLSMFFEPTGRTDLTSGTVQTLDWDEQTYFNAPRNVTATAASGTQVNVAWTDNATGETGYLVERSTNAAFTAGLTGVTVAANSASYADTTVAPSTTYYYRVTAILSPTSAAGPVAAAPVTTPAAVAPTLAGFVINDGSPQRSMITSLTLNFSQPVHLGTSAIVLSGVDMSLADVAYTLSPSNDSSVYTLTFTGLGLPGDSLADGNYALHINSAAVTSISAGLTMTADVDQTFARLFGDVDGDSSVSINDFNIFATVFGTKRENNPTFNRAFDYDDDGTISIVDFNAFATRFGVTI